MTADKNTDKPAFYITTPIYYVNDKPHIGHAYTTLACDALARFKRLDGYDVKFLTGTDEHGQKVEKSAQAAGIDAQAFTDQVSQNFRDLVKDMDVTATGFIRTTEDRHAKACQHLWRVIDQAGYLYLDNYGGWYSVRDEAYFGADELQEGPGGEKLAPTGAPVEWVEEPSYFFRLSAFQDKLLAFYEENPDFIAPDTRRNEVISFVKGGLKDLSVSRTTFSWGIPVPGDDAHVMYVWFDALTNYITELGYPDATSADWRRFWPADVHVVGKDILRFHTVYWPAFLMAAGLPLPKRVFAHGWWTNEGQKISKSLGNVIDPYDLIRDFGMDQTRYFLLREVPFGNDGDFSRAAMIGRINSDLANGFGNLAQRTLSMVNKNCGGKVPVASALTAEDTALLLQAGELADKLRGHMDKQALHLALADIWALIGEGDGYVARSEPWALKKTDPDRMAAVLYVAAEVVRHVALYAQPFIPVAAGRILDQLNVAADQRRFDQAGDAGRLVPGASINPPEGVFPRVQEMPRDKVEA